MNTTHIELVTMENDILDEYGTFTSEPKAVVIYDCFVFPKDHGPVYGCVRKQKKTDT